MPGAVTVSATLVVRLRIVNTITVLIKVEIAPLLKFAVLILLLMGFGDELCSFDVWKLPLVIELVDGGC
jgi:hypothetical protein